MEQLENIKNVWQKQKVDEIKFSKDDLYKMMSQKSSSVVKWILIISILEFILPNIFLLFTDHEATMLFYEKYGIESIMKVFFSIHFIIIIFFIFTFYKNYKNICVGNTVKELMKDILKTRRTVKYYIYYNIGMAALIGLVVFYIVFTSETFKATLPENTSILTVWILALVFFGILLLIFWGVYRLIYGLMLRKLNVNYKELKKKG